MWKYTSVHQLPLCHHGLPSNIHMVQSHWPRILLRVAWPDLNQSKAVYQAIGASLDGTPRSVQARHQIYQIATYHLTTNPIAAPPQLPLNDKTNMVFMTMVDIQGQLYTDQTGRFPITSNRGNNYVVIFYTVDANHIKTYPIKSHHRSELLRAYNDVHSYLCMWGYQPQLHKLDNESSCDVKTFITDNNASFQYTPPKIHWTNIMERAI